MVDARAASIMADLRAAARAPDPPTLLQIADPAARDRLIRALGAETQVETAATLAEAIDRLGRNHYHLAVLDHPGAPGDQVLELTGDAELIWFGSGAPSSTLSALEWGLHGILPHPLPDSDAVLKAHVRWLSGNRRTRARAMTLRSLLVRHRPQLQEIEPGLMAALADLIADFSTPCVVGLGAAVGLDLPPADPAAASPDVVVLGVSSGDRVEPRLVEARTRAAGAAVVVVDGGADATRACISLYGGARAYLPLAVDGSLLNRVVESVGRRRQAETAGRRLIEVLARFGMLDDSPGTNLPADLDARFLTDSASSGGPVVPSAHEVLVVDDEVVVLTVLREALRRGGYRVTTAASAEQAIELMRQKVFDLVLTDKNLGGASGMEVLRFANTLNPAPAVVLITGYSSYDSAAEALDIGALDYIEKPIRDVEVLRQRIRRALSRREEQQARRDGQGPTPDRARVLLVEVEADKCRLLTEYLGRHYDVVPVASGDDALARLQQERFDVVLADRNLPGMSGLRVIEQAQRLLPHCASVLYTAYPSYQSIKEAFEAGVDAYLVRPSEDLKALEQKLANALRGKGGIMLG